MTAMTSWLALSPQTQKYNSADPKQRRFNKSLQYCIAKDKLPLNLVNGKGFQHLVHAMDAKLVIPSRSTIQRRLKKDFEITVMPGLKKRLSNVKKGVISL
ncbi:unnamed protein product, partial [Allacma fusca]